ncbi:MAG TPA: CRISPR-associated endonuclease Cas1 [Stellaceae bacterium]|nr:CRISPR-associated endonuclease Cas1 [Stellaceae bacterium]
MDLQPELPLLPPPLREDQPPVPARMVNEFQYCPRLAYLEWVQGEWADSADTVEGRGVHRRVDGGSGELPEAAAIGEDERLHARSVTLSSDRLGLIARLDLIEVEDGTVVPVDYKRGRRPHVAAGAYEPERVQLCVQGLILEDNGYRCAEGALYFRESRERVRVPFDAELRSQAMAAVSGLRLIAAGRRIPPPLEDSPKCPRCSLVGICIPEEVNFLRRGTAPRPLMASRDLALPVYVQAQPARVRKRGETLLIQTEDGAETTARLIDTSHLVLLGAVDVTAPTLHELMRREIPVSWYTSGGWFLGHTIGTGHRNVELRTAQYRASFDPAFCLRLARGLVASKLRNSRTLLRRNSRQAEPLDGALGGLRRAARAAGEAANLTELLGIEGNGGAVYFGNFAAMLNSGEEDAPLRFQFENRNRRPPTDPINAMLSFAYAMLVRELNTTLSAVGFDPYRGFYHQPRYGRPALALDMMEPFRPILADSTVITAANNGELKPTDFIWAGRACALSPPGRKKMIAAFERRLATEITHPLFGYRLNYRRVLEIQARLLGRHLMGEIPELPPVEPR